MAGILSSDVEDYLIQLVPPRDDLLQELEVQAREERIPICGPQVGTLLHLLAGATRPRTALELGTAIGYSAIWIGRALAGCGGRLVTIEVDAETAARARRHLKRAGLSGVVNVAVGAALQVLPTLADPVDFIFIDAVKSEYPDYLSHGARLLRSGGVMVADNVLLGGSVADAKAKTGWSPESRDGIRRFTQMLFTHPQFRSVVLPIRDGLTLSIRV